MIVTRILFTLLHMCFVFTIHPAYGGTFTEIDSNDDGKMDQWHHMSDDNKIIKIEYDNNGDGQIDQIDIYERNKTPVRVEADRNLDGSMDQFQFYRADGSLEKIEKKIPGIPG